MDEGGESIATVRATTALRSAYRDLLREEWGDGALARAIDLVRGILERGAGVALRFAWEPERAGGRSGPKRVDLGEEASRSLADIVRRLMLADPPPPPRRIAPAKVRLARRAAEVSLLVNVTYVLHDLYGLRLVGDTALLRDAQSALFALALLEMVPDLRAARMDRELEILRASLALHLHHVWRDDLTHQAYLSGLLHEAFGAPGEARDALRFAFETTGPEAHDYLSKAHDLWFHMLDHGEHEEARQFLLHLYRTALPEHLPTIEAMIEDTYAMRSRRRRAG